MVKEKTKTWAILLMILATICNSSAQIIYKYAIDNSGLDLIKLLSSGTIILGLIMYGISGILLIISLRGGQASVLYPIYTLSFIWIALGAWWWFEEIIQTKSIIGMIAVVVGIILINMNSKEKNNSSNKKQKLAKRGLTL